MGLGLAWASSTGSEGQVPGLRAGDYAALSNLADTVLRAGDTLRWAPGALFAHTLAAIGPGGDTLVFAKAGPDAAYVPTLPDTTPVRWRYRRFDTRLRAPRYAVDSVLLDNNRPAFSFDAADAAISVSRLQRDLGDVDYSGVFGRGLRFGNSQNLVLDSRLDLQLNGDLGDGLSVAAVVSDQNIPLQPEGNTVQLREFDRLFVTVAKDEHAITAGDYTLRANTGHFIRFDKNLQGLSYRYGTPPDPTAGAVRAPEPLTAQASLAASRGDFQRIQLPVADGNQGPYRLTGARGEAFVVVLAGTERVYLDGRLLERGLDRDYVIDYNRGEVTFMPRLLVNRFQRVIVEYEYSDREYLRTLASAEASYRLGPVRLRVQGLQQQDGLRRSGSALSAEAERVIAAASGAEGGTLVPSALPIDPDEGSANPIQYRRRTDSTACGVDTVFVLDDGTVADAQRFTVTFTEVGPGLGDYELGQGANANGASFRYVPRGPDCEPRGSFAAERLVQTPRSLQLVTVGGTFAPDSASRLDFEVAANRNDLNRFNPGGTTTIAGHVSGTHRRRLGEADVTASGYGEVTGDGFTAIAPWRAAEFRRLWNLGRLSAKPTGDAGGDLLVGGGVGIAYGGWTASYGADAYRQADAYEGLRQNWQTAFTRGRLTARHTGDVLSATRDGTPTGQSRLSADVEQRGRTWTNAARLSRQTSENYDLVSDATGQTDRRVYEWSARTARQAGDTAWSQALAYSGRSDEVTRATGERLGEGVKHQLDLTLANPAERRNRLELTASYRRTEQPEETRASSTPRDFYLGRLTHRFAARRQSWFRTQSLVEAGSGQERRASVQYVRVQSGLGEYVWRDYNGDGVEQIDEFEVAVFADSAGYIRTVSLTDDFVATNTLTVTQALDVDLGRLKRAKMTGARASTAEGTPATPTTPAPPTAPAGARGVASGPGVREGDAWWQRLSSSTNAKLRRRALQEAGYQRLLATGLDEADTTVVGDDLAWRTALYLNRNRDAFRAEVEYRQVAVRGITLQGLQVNRTTAQTVRMRQPLGEALLLGGDVERELRISESDALEQRNFAIASYRAAPSLSYQPAAAFRVEGSGGYRRAASPDGGGEVTATSLELTVDLRLPEAELGSARRSPLAGATLRGSVERVVQVFEGVADSPLGFALLEGLQPGRSWLWNLTTDQQLGRSLQLSLRYDGRQLGGGRVVHTGQAQLQAVF